MGESEETSGRAGAGEPEQDDAGGSAARVGGPESAGAGEQCTWCGARVDREDGYRIAESPGERRAVFCRLEHVVPWALQGAHWMAGTPEEPSHVADGLDACAHCGEPLGDV